MKNKILIIEDNADVRENLSEIFILSGYETITAANGKIGVQLAIEKLPDLILCDIMMPELDGYGVLRILSRNPKTMTIPFVFLTAKTDMSEMRRGMTLGADDYITKPFDDVELLNTIEIRLAKKKAQGTSETSSSLSTSMSRQQVIENFPAGWRESEPRLIHKKDLLYSEGQNARYVFIVDAGKALASKVDDYSKEVITRMYLPGDVIGLAAALTGHRYTETVRAFEELKVLPVRIDEFVQHILQDKSLSFYFMSLIARDQVRADEKLLMQSYSPVRVKLANVLIDLYEAFQQDGTATIPVQRDELAAMAGTAKETTIRCLSEFKDEGLVKISGTEITIDDIKKLLDLRY